MDAIASTIGNLVVDNVAGQATNTGTLYGVGGDINGMVQGAYTVDAGKQFAWLANEQLNSGSMFDATAASLGLTTQAAHGLIQADNGRSIVGSPLSPEVEGHAVPYPQISVSSLPESGVTLAQTEGGFWRGLSGDRRSVFEGPAPLSEKIGAGVRAVGEFIVDPLIEVGNQYRDVAAAATGAAGGWHSAFAQQVSAGSYGGAALTEFGAVAGAMPLAGATLKGVASVAPALADTAYFAVESYAAKTGLVSYIVENGPIGTSSNIWRTGDSLAEGLTQSQAKNLDRYLDKLPANAQDFRVGNLPNGGVVFQANSPAANIQGSFVAYEKQVDAFGNTVLYTKTTYAPDGRIVHVAPKYPVGPKLFPGQ
ncbi:hypothetical protein [Paraburkholderia sp. MM6662-R1]|uniref:hypothetical protein n=1 Tax=Paraburkholderia sp. MM6662-R1 TaxID=2991066 RepID=UPI003D1ABD3C